jgi:hypothetical protein
MIVSVSLDADRLTKHRSPDSVAFPGPIRLLIGPNRCHLRGSNP